MRQVAPQFRRPPDTSQGCSAAIEPFPMEPIMTRILPAMLLALGLAACADPAANRALIGGGLGAGAGAGVAALTGGNPLVGAAIGGAGGAVVGAATTPRQPRGYYD
jgi:hypothetical protein